MSHFTVLVKVDPETLESCGKVVPEAVHKLLAPYQENNMGDCPAEFMEFVDIEDEYRELYTTEDFSEKYAALTQRVRNILGGKAES